MNLILTGGGTGGHIYPALEVGRALRSKSYSLHYFGSFRGQERAACERESIPFTGFASEPLWSLKTPKGWKALLRLLKAERQAMAALRQERPDAVFSTGGYSAGPVVGAARKLGIPYVIHEANSMPGRSNRLFADRAHAFATVFRQTEQLVRFPVVRTGMPIRAALRQAALERGERQRLAVVLGGSQGSAFLNEICPKAAAGTSGVAWLHSTGPAHIEAVLARLQALSLSVPYQAEPYLDTQAMTDAYRTAGVAVARSGGTLAEFAAFRLPSVLIPLPTAADNHQMRNAREFEAMGAAVVVPQGTATPEALAEAVRGWFEDDERRAKAEAAMSDWDIPDATDRIVALVESAGQARRR